MISKNIKNPDEFISISLKMLLLLCNTFPLDRKESLDIKSSMLKILLIYETLFKRRRKNIPLI